MNTARHKQRTLAQHHFEVRVRRQWSAQRLELEIPGHFNAIRARTKSHEAFRIYLRPRSDPVDLREATRPERTNLPVVFKTPIGQTTRYHRDRNLMARTARNQEGPEFGLHQDQGNRVQCGHDPIHQPGMIQRGQRTIHTADQLPEATTTGGRKKGRRHRKAHLHETRMEASHQGRFSHTGSMEPDCARGALGA